MSMNGVSTNWRTSQPFRRVLVETSNQYRCEVVDLATGQQTSLLTITPTREIPMPGDIWIISNEIGQWSFHRLVDSISNETSMATELSIRLDAARRRSYRWQPFDNPRSNAVEVPQGAYIGERRLFETSPGGRWILCNTAAVSRQRYRALFEVIGSTYGPGDGISTFNVPGQESSLLSNTYLRQTGGSDYAVTTTSTAIPGLSWSYTIPAAANPANYTLDVTATVAVSHIYLAGLPDSEAILKLNGFAVTVGGFSHSLEWQPVSNDPCAFRSGQWKVDFSTTGLQTVSLDIAKADSTGTVTALRKNTSMQVRLYCSGVSGSQWYICAE